MSLQKYSQEVGEDHAFQQRVWRFERAGWAVVALLLLGALAGLFSGGLLGRATATDPDGLLSIEYDRFARHASPTLLRIRVAGAREGATTLHLSRSLIESFEIERIRPQPESELSAPGRIEIVVRLGPGGVLTLSGKPSSYLLGSGEIAVEGHAAARLEWFIWP